MTPSNGIEMNKYAPRIYCDKQMYRCNMIGARLYNTNN